MSVARMIEVVSGALLLAIPLTLAVWWNGAVVKPRDRLLECGPDKACRAEALRDFTAHHVVAARLNQLSR